MKDIKILRKLFKYVKANVEINEIVDDGDELIVSFKSETSDVLYAAVFDKENIIVRVNKGKFVIFDESWKNNEFFTAYCKFAETKKDDQLTKVILDLLKEKNGMVDFSKVLNYDFDNMLKSITEHAKKKSVNSGYYMVEDEMWNLVLEFIMTKPISLIEKKVKEKKDVSK